MDFSDVPEILQGIPRDERNLGGIAETFPERLHRMLEQDEYPEIVSWAYHGRAFLVHKPIPFSEEVMPKFFYQSQ